MTHKLKNKQMIKRYPLYVLLKVKVQGLPAGKNWRLEKIGDSPILPNKMDILPSKIEGDSSI